MYFSLRRPFAGVSGHQEDYLDKLSRCSNAFMRPVRVPCLLLEHNVPRNGGHSNHRSAGDSPRAVLGCELVRVTKDLVRQYCTQFHICDYT